MLFFHPSMFTMLHDVAHPHVLYMPSSLLSLFSPLWLFVTPMHLQYMFPLASLFTNLKRLEVPKLSKDIPNSRVTWVKPLSPGRLAFPLPSLTLRHKRVTLKATRPSSNSHSRLAQTFPLHPIPRIQHLDKARDARQRMVQLGGCEWCDPRQPVL